jgi:hypothetical protein
MMMFGLAFSFGGAKLRAIDEKLGAFTLTGEVEPSALAEPGKMSRIVSFDVSPDGSTLALLYENGRSDNWIPGSEELGIAVWDIASRKIVREQQLGLNRLPLAARATDAKGVMFTSDQQYLVALGLQKVWVLDGRTCTVTHTVESFVSEPGIPVQIQAAGASGLAITYELEHNRFRTDLFDLASVKRVAGWSSSVIPQSFSPDGNLAVASDTSAYNVGGVTNLKLLNGKSGTTIKSIPVGFGFKKNWRGELPVTGGVIAQFISNEQIVVVPDGTRDRGGHRAGDSIELIDIGEGRVTREITPAKFGPTGVLVVSADRSHFVAESIYASSIWLSLESTNPRHYTHQAIVFDSSEIKEESRLAYPQPKADSHPPVGGLSVALRCSRDASILAIRAGDQDLKIFRSAGEPAK